MTTTTHRAGAARFQPADVRRRQILDAAARLAVEQGPERMTIAQVAQAAGIAKGSIYLHYDSRQQLLAALQADLWERLLERPSAIVADGSRSWAERLDAVIEHWMRFEFEHHDLYHAVFHQVAADTDEPMVRAHALLAELLDGGVAADEFDLHGLERESVLGFLLHGYLGPCFHHQDQELAIQTAQRIFRRVVGVSGTD